MRFLERQTSLPVLGMGISTEYGAAAAPGALDLRALRRAAPRLARFLEVGVEVSKGLDEHAVGWSAAGLPTTYHFLDVNLDEEADFAPGWLKAVDDLIGRLSPAWLCGDAGLWHFGPRDRAHMLLLPPVLTDDAADDLAAGIRRLRDATGLEVLPENPPGVAFVGDLGLLDFFARVVERADTGMLLDCAHLAMAQRQRGRDPLDGLDDFPLDRIVEMHVAGGTVRTAPSGFSWVEDDHTVAPLAETWAIFAHVVERAPNLRAVVVECERNPLEQALPLLRKVERMLRGSPLDVS